MAFDNATVIIPLFVALAVAFYLFFLIGLYLFFINRHLQPIAGRFPTASICCAIGVAAFCSFGIFEVIYSGLYFSLIVSCVTGIFSFYCFSQFFFVLFIIFVIYDFCTRKQILSIVPCCFLLVT